MSAPYDEPRSLDPSQPRRRPVLLCDVEPLAYKDVAHEIRGHKDLLRIANDAPILVDLDAPTPPAVVRALITALVDAGQLPSEAVADTTAALYGREPLVYSPRPANNSEDAFDSSDPLLPTDAPSDPQSPATFIDSHWHRHILGSGFIIPFASINSLDSADRPIVAIARLATNSNLGVPNGSLVRFVVLVLGPVRDIKETKTPFELARSIASLFQEDDFFADARRASSPDAFRDAIRLTVDTSALDARTHDAQQRVESSLDRDFARTGRFAGGLIADIKRRYNFSVYISDWKDGVRDARSISKFISTTVWLYFAIIMPTIAFGALDDNNTSNQIGVIETLISQAFAGIVFAVFAGQPLTIVMTTAPITVFIEVLSKWCKSLGIKFLPFYAWTGIWTAIILLILVVTDACFVMKYCGHFTEEIFAMLIAALFISEFIKPLIHVRQDEEVDIFLLSFLLAGGTFLIATVLLNFRRSFLLKPVVRDLLSDFGVPIAILVMTAARRSFLTIDLESLKVPEQIGVVTTSGRPWLINIFDINVRHIFLALVSGALLATLFFLDQNISSMLVNKVENKLRKGPGYYLDLVVVSVIIVVQSIMGMPWTHAALPHSPLHARQLADVDEYEQHGRRYERVVKARETRITGFATHVLIGLSILAKDALKLIPVAVLYGFFLFLGIETLDGNAFWDRILLIFTQPEKLPPNHYVRRVKIQRIHLYTFVQILLLVLLWFVKSNFYIKDSVFNTGLLFPFIIALFIPIRLYILPRIFTQTELHALSKEEEENVSDSGITV